MGRQGSQQEHEGALWKSKSGPAAGGIPTPAVGKSDEGRGQQERNWSVTVEVRIQGYVIHGWQSGQELEPGSYTADQRGEDNRVVSSQSWGHAQVNRRNRVLQWAKVPTRDQAEGNPGASRVTNRKSGYTQRYTWSWTTWRSSSICYSLFPCMEHFPPVSELQASMQHACACSHANYRPHAGCWWKFLACISSNRWRGEKNLKWV